MEENKTIVIAEDSPTQAVRLQFVLEENNYNVHCGKDGKQALEIIREVNPDLIISDIIMPVMDGYDLTKHVKKDPKINKIPVILLTSLSDLSDILKGLECGADNYIIKPFDENDLILKIEKAITKNVKGITEYYKGDLRITYGECLYKIDSKSTKLADFLITTCETALQKNKALEKAQNDLRILNESLEEKVKERTYELLKEVTERKQYQFALEESEKKYRFLFNDAPDGIIHIDSKGIIINCNEYESELVGYKKEEIIGKHLTFFENKESTNKFEKRLIDLQKKGYLEAEVFLCRNDGTVFPVWRKVSALYNDRGTFTGAIVHTRDITQRKKTEVELINAKEKAEESDRLKTAFLKNMSHEIRTPMNSILGFTYLLDEPELTGEQLNEYVDIIRLSGDRMLNTVNNLMDISLIESEQTTISISKTNVNKQIEKLYNFYKPEVESKGIQLHYYNSLPDDESIIETDEIKFIAILTNLINNAIKFTLEGIIEFGYKKKDGCLLFFVKDTGIGIPKNRQEAIFDRFVQADIEDEMVFEGAGLGLSISKAFIEMLGGRIWVESDEGKGSRFYFTISYDSKIGLKQPEFDESSEKIIENQIGGMKVLIAEDEETTDAYLSIVVKNISREILHAKTGIEALELCRKNQDIDFILMDVKMPLMNGYEATKQIREFNKDIIIIAHSAYSNANERFRAMNAGCNDYISKPVKKDSLIEILKKHVL